MLSRKAFAVALFVILFGVVLSMVGLIIGPARGETGLEVGTILFIVGFIVFFLIGAIGGLAIYLSLILLYENRQILKDYGTPESKTKMYTYDYFLYNDIKIYTASRLMKVKMRYFIFSVEGLFYNLKGIKYDKEELLKWENVESLSLYKSSKIKVPTIKVEAINVTGEKFWFELPNSESIEKLLGTFCDKEILPLAKTTV